MKGMSINMFRVGAIAFTLISHTGAAQHFFSEPDAPFFASVNETVVRVVLPEAVAAGDAQALIDAARAKSPHSVLILETRGPLQVTDAHLRLGSRMCLQFLEGRRDIRR